MKHAIACLNTQIGILLHNASVFHGEGREEDRDRCIAEAYDLRAAVENLKDRVPAPVGITLEVGKRYVRRDGKITDPLVSYTGSIPEFTLKDPKTDAGYRTDGTWTLSGMECSVDLVAEYVEPNPQEDSVKPPPGFTYYGPGPLRVLATGGLLDDVARFSHEWDIQQWNMSGWTGKIGGGHYALRTGSEIALLNGLAEGEIRTPLETERQRCIDAERKRKPGYRMLEIGEALEPGDEVRMVSEWHPLPERCFGMTVNPTGGFNRPVGYYRRPVKSGPQYRMLEVGEVTQSGDEAHTDSGVWTRLTRCHLGQQINKRGSYPVGYYRRPISLDTESGNPETPAA